MVYGEGSGLREDLYQVKFGKSVLLKFSPIGSSIWYSSARRVVTLHYPIVNSGDLVISNQIKLFGVSPIQATDVADSVWPSEDILLI